MTNCSGLFRLIASEYKLYRKTPLNNCEVGGVLIRLWEALDVVKIRNILRNGENNFYGNSHQVKLEGSLIYPDEIVEYPDHSETPRELVDAMRELKIHNVSPQGFSEVFLQMLYLRKTIHSHEILEIPRKVK